MTGQSREGQPTPGASTEAQSADRGNMQPIGIAALTLSVVVAFFIYRPDRELPFDHLDFSEFLPILQGSESFWERSWELTRYYASHGRANVLPYALLSAKWEMFGWWSPGWQWSRFVVMIGVVVLGFRLLRRLGATALGAVAGASVFLVAPAAARGWIRLTMGEPLGTFLLLALCLTTLPARRLRGSRPRWIVAGLLVVCILLTKEMLAATLVLPLGLLVLTDEDGQLAKPTMTRQVRQSVTLFAVIGFTLLIPMLRMALVASEGRYAALYGISLRPIGQTMANWLSTYAPIDPVHGLPGWSLRIALALFAGLVAAGSWMYVRPVRVNGHRAWFLGLALLLPLICALIYAPWPAYQEFYSLPYLVGTSILIAFALTGFHIGASPVIQVAAHGCWGLLFLVGAVGAHWQAGVAAATQSANYRLVTRVSGMAGIDSVFVPTPNIAPQRWQGPAGTLRRYAAALGLPWPGTRDVPCVKAGGPGAGGMGRTVIVYRADLCDQPASEQIVEHFSRFSFRQLRLVDDSVRIGIESAEPPVSGSAPHS